MAKKNWGKVAYRGRPDPSKAANRIMLFLVALLLLGFINAGIKNGWFEFMSGFFSF